MTTGKTIALTRWTFVGKVMSLLFNMLSRLVITFLPRSKRLLISVTICSDFWAPKNKFSVLFNNYSLSLGFPDNSVGKESAYDARDPSSTPGLGRSTRERISYPLQYSWASLVAQLVKNPPAMQETWVRSRGWEDSLENRKATHSSIPAWRISWTVQSMGS